MAGAAAGIPVIDFNAVRLQSHLEYISDFKKLFKVTKNGTLQCKKSDIPIFNTFIQKWNGYFRENDILLNHVQLEQTNFGDIATVNANKQKLLRLYGVAFQLYLKSCRFIKEQPDDQYGDIVVIEIPV